MKHLKQILFVLVLGLFIYLMIRPGPGPEPKINTVIEYKTKTDTIYKTRIGKPAREPREPKTNTIYKTDTIYLDTATAILENLAPGPPRRRYPVTLETENGTADLSILTTGRLLDVTGTITTREKTTTIEKTKWVNKNTLYVYGQTSIFPMAENVQIGLDYTIRNKIIIGTSIGYNAPYNYGSLNLKIGIKIK